MSSQGQGQKRSRHGKEVATSSSAQATETWPRTPGKAFKLPAHLNPNVLTKEKSQRVEGFYHRATSEGWLQYHSIFYNGLLNMTFDPTRVIKKETLEQLQISRPVGLLLRRMGLGNITYESYDLYTDLARQFLATCEVLYNYDCDDPAAGRLTFLCHGRRYSLSLDELVSIFKFATDS